MPSPSALRDLAAWMDRHEIAEVRSVRIDSYSAVVEVGIEVLLRLEPNPRAVKTGSGRFGVARIDGVRVIGIP